jgi:hypothetical protein
MEKISNLFGERKSLPKKKRRSERSDLIEYFYLNANADRDGKKYKKLPVTYYAWKLSHLKVPDLDYLKSVCEDAERRGGSWSKVFWGSLKPRKEL